MSLQKSESGSRKFRRSGSRVSQAVSATMRWPSAVAADAFEKERDQGSVILFRQAWKDLGELASVLLAHVGRDHHAGDHNLRVWIPRADAVDDCLQVPFGFRNVEAAKSVVAAELQDKDIDRTPKDPVDPSRPGRAGFTAQSGVDDVSMPAGFARFLFNQRRVGIVGINAVSGCETVSEEDNGQRRAGVVLV